MNIKQRKKELIRQYIHKNPEKLMGMKMTSRLVILLFSVRILLFIYEAIFFGVSRVPFETVSNLLLLPYFVLLYMIFDGNKSMASITFLSAIIRVIYLFSSTFNKLPENTASYVFIGVAIFVYLIQAICSLIINSSKACEIYSSEMKKINIKLQSEFLSKR